MKTINVKSYDHGFLTQEDIPITRKENGIIMWCNHADVGTEITEYGLFSGIVEYCNTCDAYKHPKEDEWHNSPCEGRH